MVNQQSVGELPALPPMPPLPPAPSLPPIPEAGGRSRSVLWDVFIALIAALAALAGTYVGIHAQQDDNERIIKSQQDANTKTIKAQTKLLRRQSRQEQGGFLREQREAAYSEFVRQDQALRREEHAWSVAESRGNVAVLEGFRARAKDLYPALARARLDVQLVASCQPREAVKRLDNAHRQAIIVLRRIEPSADALADVESASGLFLVAARNDLRHGGRLHRKCTPT